MTFKQEQIEAMSENDLRDRMNSIDLEIGKLREEYGAISRELSKRNEAEPNNDT